MQINEAKQISEEKKREMQSIIQYCDKASGDLINNNITNIVKQAMINSSDEKFAGKIVQFFYKYINEGQRVVGETAILPPYAFEGCNLGENTFYVPNKVTALHPYAFAKSIATSIRIDCGTTIPAHCFDGSTVKEVELGEGITTIADNAFTNCPKLERVICPNSIRLIEEKAFEQCRQNAAEALTLEIPAELLADSDKYQFEIVGYNFDLAPGEQPDHINAFYDSVIEPIGETPEEEDEEQEAPEDQQTKEPIEDTNTPPAEADVEETENN